jgi:hypothetical protein
LPSKACTSPWLVARDSLEAARALLPKRPTTRGPSAEVLGSLEQYREYLEHSELELALEELESLGELNAMPASFWGLLKKAADSLEMPEHSNYYAGKI